MYTLGYYECVLTEHIPDLPKTMRLRIQKAIENRLTIDPVGYGKPLQYSMKGCRRLCEGDYRVVYRLIEEHSQVMIVGIGHRKDIYDMINSD